MLSWIEAALPEESFRCLVLPLEAAFLAGKAFLKYRQQKGIRTSTLPDFFIGAHAAVAEMRLLTRDTARYQSYFPTVKLYSEK